VVWSDEVKYLHEIGDLFPLFGGRIAARGVVGAGVEDDDGVFRGVLQIFNHSLEVERPRLGVPITVLPLIWEAGMLENQAVVSCVRNSFTFMKFCSTAHSYLSFCRFLVKPQT